MSEDALFDLKPQQRLQVRDVVEVTMSWGEVWRCSVESTGVVDGWPRARLHRLTGKPWAQGDDFTVDLARCRPVVETADLLTD